MRPDQRQPDQMRAVRIQTDYLLTAEGSVMIEVGNTRVLCAATVDESVPQWRRGSGKGWITAEYSMLPRSTVTRTPREAVRGRPSGRTHEIQRMLGRALRAVVNLNALGERSVILDCDVLQADGGTRTASLTGAYVAMAIAIQRLVEFGTLKQSPVREAVAAASVGIVNGEPLLDLCYDEDSRADVDMNVVITSSGRLVEVQATAEQTPFEEAQMARMLELAKGGIQQLLDIQREALKRK